MVRKNTAGGALRAAATLGCMAIACESLGDIHFSHDVNTVGLPGSAVQLAPDVRDVFGTLLPLGGPGAFSNVLVADNPLAFGLLPGDNVDALHDSGVRQYGASGVMSLNFVFSVRPGASGQPATPVDLQEPFNAADLFLVDANQSHLLLNNEDQFGLSSANLDESVDGLALEPGAPFALARRVHFSLAPGSPTLLNNGWSAADVLTAVVGIPGTLAVSIPAANLGLLPGDDIDGLVIYEALDDDGDGLLNGPTDRASVYFSVAGGSIGAPGTAVRAQAAPGGNGAANDIFTSGAVTPGAPGANTLVIDGIGWTRLAAGDDIDGLDVLQVFFGNPPFLVPGVLPPPPTRDPATLPPGYQFNRQKPIGGFWVPICALDTGRIVNWEIIAKLCDPQGNPVAVIRNGNDRLRGPGDAKYKTDKIAEILAGMTILNPGGDPMTDTKNLFTVSKAMPPVNVPLPGAVAEVCAVVNQDVIDRGWALDGMCISFNNWTMSIVTQDELGFGPPPPPAAHFRLPGVKLAAPPDDHGMMRLSFWNGSIDKPEILQYIAPFAAGQKPLSILQILRQQIIDDGGDAEFDGDLLLIAKVPVQPDPEMNAESGPTLFEAGALGNQMMVTVDVRATGEQLPLLGCGGFLTDDCCTPSPNAGCNDAACCNAVCAIDPFCCDAFWDINCAQQAQSLPDCPCQGVPGDVNGDGLVNVTDLLAVINAWGPCPPPPVACPADVDGNGQVGVTDLLLVINNWS